ncbi:hypothetical protein EJB05_29959 [Eragrostis curvula]|uniref:Uncharacterized protein n=1 Tax=Eragrostis curvula TaxID=38414 RepID=A0A5J9UVF6_9POAL|nr:hypothetical protein EJB05_29959 [Eragrostis curvula]
MTPRPRAAAGVPRGRRAAAARALGRAAHLPRRRRVARPVQALVQGTSRPPQIPPLRQQPDLPGRCPSAHLIRPRPAAPQQGASRIYIRKGSMSIVFYGVCKHCTVTYECSHMYV